MGRTDVMRRSTTEVDGGAKKVIATVLLVLGGIEMSMLISVL